MILEELMIIWSDNEWPDMLESIKNNPLSKYLYDASQIAMHEDISHCAILERDKILSSGYEDGVMKEGIKNYSWWSTSGTSRKGKLKVCFPYNFHATHITCAYQSILNVNITTSPYAHLCSPAISSLVLVPEKQGMTGRMHNGELYLSPQTTPDKWTNDDYHRITRDLESFRPEVLRADPNYLMTYLHWLIRNEIEIPNIRLIISSYSLLTNKIRNILHRYFSAQIIDLYAMSEIGPIYFDNGDEVYPYMKDTIIEAEPISYTRDGGLVCQSIISSTRNPYFPLLRYKTGDLMEITLQDNKITKAIFCGREYQRIAGDKDEVLTERDISSWFDGVSDIWSYRIRMNGKNVSVTVVPNIGIGKKSVAELTQNILVKHLSNDCAIQVDVNDVNQFEESGKFLSFTTH